MSVVLSPTKIASILSKCVISHCNLFDITILSITVATKYTVAYIR